MAKTKQQYILATCFLSGAAAIISFVSLGTQEWVNSVAKYTDENITDDKSVVNYGLFSGVFKQSVIFNTTYDLTTVCRYDLNICALLCGDNMSDNLEKLYYGAEDNQTTTDSNECATLTKSMKYNQRSNYHLLNIAARANTADPNRTFINAGVWLCTIIFLIFSAVMGLFSAGLAVWNTATNPVQVYLSVFGLYIYNAIAFSSVLLSVILWGAMYSSNLSDSEVPCYKTLLEGFVTKNEGQLGYSYWILLASLGLYLTSICLLFLRNYLISREPKVNVQIEDNSDPVIYLY